ncbi:hypothetical protein Q9L58_002836 [Maublancomyces gigas]|uniref:BTB domain-containing protein n=1 Tax=Discina gigas TaxID=1032678 RepID=A0ABR3GQN4_9PEZI
MTPIVTIYVGDDRVQYRAYEDQLCKLPFFRAALHGEFKEAVDKTINMPEDDPEAVAVLLEWLAVGTYTFDGNRLQKSTMAAREMSETTTSDTLLRALFDLEVCVVASKYDAQDLVTKAKENFYKSQTGFKAIDILRLWRAYSTTGLDGFPFPEKSSFKAREIVRSLARDHRAELVSAVVKSPLLGLLFLEACAAEDPMETSRKKRRH